MRQVAFLLFFFFLATNAMAQTYTSGLTSTGSGSGTDVRLGGANPLLVNTTIDLDTFSFGFKKSSVNYFSILSNGNIGIGNSTPNASALLDISSLTKGVLLPRLTTVQMNAITSPANGLIITNTDSTNRLFIYNGSGWRGLSFTAEQANDTALVHKGGIETIYGNKTFLRDVKINDLTVGNGGGDLWPNTVIGFRALESNTTGNFNTALGYYSLHSNTTGEVNAGAGPFTLYLNTTGSYNNAFGCESLYSNTTGSWNTASGLYSLYYNTTGNYNTGTGPSSLESNTTGQLNSAFGEYSLYSNTTGDSNSVFGGEALFYNTTGRSNVAAGNFAGSNIADGISPLTKSDRSIFIGTNTQALGDSQTNQIVIGYRAIGHGSNSATWGNSSIANHYYSGQHHWLNYGAGSNTGTVSKMLGVTSTGDIIEVAPGGEGSFWGLSGNSGTNTSTNFIGTTDNVGLTFRTNNTTKLQIDATGNVGIGTQNTSDSSYKLFVETGIRTRKVKVDALVWSDYVFDNNYKLPSLAEVENFIQKNKHLPGVQSAKEVEKNGIDLAETDATLLKKVEELTLYMIELNKKVESLAKENELLKEKIAISK